MLYRQKFDTFIRRYDDVGYICSKSDFGDRVLDSAGAVFLSALSRKPQSLMTEQKPESTGESLAKQLSLGIKSAWNARGCIHQRKLYDCGSLFALFGNNHTQQQRIFRSPITVSSRRAFFSAAVPPR
jgi:hypothetical protein